MTIVETGPTQKNAGNCSVSENQTPFGVATV